MTPPGYRDLGTIRDELGAVQLCDQVFSGNLQAFFLSPNSHIVKCAKKLWSSDHGEIAMRSGRLRDDRIVISCNEADRKVTSADEDQPYMSPFIKLMLKASRSATRSGARSMQSSRRSGRNRE